MKLEILCRIMYSRVPRNLTMCQDKRSNNISPLNLCSALHLEVLPIITYPIEDYSREESRKINRTVLKFL